MWLVNGIGVVVLLIFGIIFAKALAYQRPEPFPPELAFILTTVSGMLAANLGALVGVTVSAKATRTEVPVSWFQIVAAIAYSVIVVIAWIVWAKRGFPAGLTGIVPVIPEMCRTGLGIVLGVFALALGVGAPRKTQSERNLVAEES